MRPKKKIRLRRVDWLVVSLNVLAEDGISAVTVDRLANLLAVTRGSFYHHFEGRDEFLVAMLEYWMTEWTLSVREQVKALDLDPANMLLALVKTIRHKRASHYDAAVRAWAMSHKPAGKYLMKADKLRLEYIKSLFADLGFKDSELENRARLFLYYEAFDPMMSVKLNKKDEDALIKLRLDLLTARF